MLWVYWAIAAVILFIFELFSGTIYLLMLVIACICAIISSFLFSNSIISIWTAIGVALIGIICVYRYRNSIFNCQTNSENQLNNDLDIGNSVILEKQLNNGQWQVYYRGTLWEANFLIPHNAQQGENAIIDGKNGNSLILKIKK